jgi:hypothetical protein
MDLGRSQVFGSELFEAHTVSLSHREIHVRRSPYAAMSLMANLARYHWKLMHNCLDLQVDSTSIGKNVVSGNERRKTKT